jgi:hypothetical protein
MLKATDPIEAWRAERERLEGPASWPVGATLRHRREAGVTGRVVAQEPGRVTVLVSDPELGPSEADMMHSWAWREWEVA